MGIILRAGLWSLSISNSQTGFASICQTYVISMSIYHKFFYKVYTLHCIVMHLWLNNYIVYVYFHIIHTHYTVYS